MGVVTKVTFSDNPAVKAGQVLAEIDDAPAKARLAQAEANLEVALAQVEAAEADSRLTDTSARANRSVTSASLQAASAGAVSSRDQIGEAEARVASAQSALTRHASPRREVRGAAGSSEPHALITASAAATSRQTSAAGLRDGTAGEPTTGAPRLRGDEESPRPRGDETEGDRTRDSYRVPRPAAEEIR